MKPPVHSAAAIKAFPAPDISHSGFNPRWTLQKWEPQVPFRKYAIACMTICNARLAYDKKFPSK